MSVVERSERIVVEERVDPRKCIKQVLYDVVVDIAVPFSDAPEVNAVNIVCTDMKPARIVVEWRDPWGYPLRAEFNPSRAIGEKEHSSPRYAWIANRLPHTPLKILDYSAYGVIVALTRPERIPLLRPRPGAVSAVVFEGCRDVRGVIECERASMGVVKAVSDNVEYQLTHVLKPTELIKVAVPLIVEQHGREFKSIHDLAPALVFYSGGTVGALLGDGSAYLLTNCRARARFVRREKEIKPLAKCIPRQIFPIPIRREKEAPMKRKKETQPA